MDNPVDREKDEAINRILYGDEDGDARSRLEERRRRRETAKAAAPTRSIFAREPLTPEEVPSVPETPKPVLSETKYAPPEKHAPAREPESPKRRDFSGFVFGENAEERRRATESGASIPAAPQETDPFRNFTDFAVAPLQPPVYTAPAPEEVAAPADSTFALHVDEEQKTLFAIDKKNEAFQELLDEEYRRKRERDAELERLRGQVGTAAPEQNFPASTFAIPTPEPAISESETSRPAAERSDELGGEAASNPMRTSKAQPSAYTGGLTWLDQDHAAAKEAEVDTWGKILEGQETADNHAEQAVAAGANLDVDETPDWLKELESLSAGVYGSAPAPAIPKPVVPEPVMYVTPVPEPVEAVPEPAAVIPEPVIPEPVMYVTPVPEPVEAVPEPAAVIPEPVIPEPVA
ncbi:MAG: hypothetical protein FWF33_00450, partial [Clostridiales bacterium]|nr:hypothetical protein [Clostridiales bacterium]